MIIAKTWQRADGALTLAAALTLLALTDHGVPWWALAPGFFLPDLAMAGYLAGPRVGAWLYNLAHLPAGGIILIAAGSVTGNTGLLIAGALWLGHCGFDRLLGYGLKSPEGFQHTHLGRIGGRGA